MKRFFNITSHPSVNWPENQAIAAKTYDISRDDDPWRELIDLAHPKIDPSASPMDVYNQARKFLDDAKLQYGAIGPDDICLVQGEYTFVTCLVSMLTNAGVTCVTATTERKVQEFPDGSVRRWFEFVQYRPYILVDALPR